MLVEISKRGTDDCARKEGGGGGGGGGGCNWREDSGMEKEIGGCLGSSDSQTGLKFKKKRKVALNGHEVRRMTKVQPSGPKSIANKNDKVGFTKVSNPFFEACNQEECDQVQEALEEDQAHLLAQSSLKQGLCMGGRKNPGSLSIHVLSSKDASCSRDARACNKKDFCDPVARFQCRKSETSEELGLSRRNQATHEMLREEGSRYTPFLTRGSCEFSSFSISPSFSPSSRKRKDIALARESFCLNEVFKENEERIFLTRSRLLNLR